MLLEVGADVNKADALESGPIHHAVRRGQTEIIRVLAEAGADLNWESKDVRTPLSMAIEIENLEMIRVLVAAGEDVNRLDLEHRSNPPLLEACFLGNEAIARLLLDAGADVGLANVSGFDPLMSAAGQGHLGVVKLLVEAGADVESIRSGGYFTPLSIATLRESLEVVRYLLEVGAEVDRPTGEMGGTVLLGACQGDQILFANPLT